MLERPVDVDARAEAGRARGAGGGRQHDARGRGTARAVPEDAVVGRVDGGAGGRDEGRQPGRAHGGLDVRDAVEDELAQGHGRHVEQRRRPRHARRAVGQRRVGRFARVVDADDAEAVRGELAQVGGVDSNGRAGAGRKYEGRVGRGAVAEGWVYSEERGRLELEVRCEFREGAVADTEGLFKRACSGSV